MKLFFIFLAGALALLPLAAALTHWQRRRRLAYIEHYEFPPGVASGVRKRYPHLSEADLHEVITGLRQYFVLALRAQQRLLAMPSQVVDVAWHEFILFTRDYQHFCRGAFGRFLHHKPAEAMRSRTVASEGIRRAWRLACAQENLSPRTPQRLPRLFAMDDRLRIPDGFRYALNCMALTAASTAGGGSGVVYCGSHIACGSGNGGCASDSGCSGSGGSGDGGGDGGGGGGCGGGGD